MRVNVDDNIRKYLSPKMAAIYDIGTATGLRISDILQLRVYVLKIQKPTIHEQKTGKSKRIYIPTDTRKYLLQLCANYNDDDYIFKSSSKSGHISRQSVYQSFKRAERKTGNNINIGTHSMRKSYAQKQLRRGKTYEQIQLKLNHSNLSDTLRYMNWGNNHDIM